MAKLNFRIRQGQICQLKADIQDYILWQLQYLPCHHFGDICSRDVLDRDLDLSINNVCPILLPFVR